MTDFDSTFRWRPGHRRKGAADGVAPAEEPAAPTEAYLVVIAHPEETVLGRRFQVSRGASLVIGRSSDADISFPSVTSISRHHARVSVDERTFIEDLGSTNGTLVNDAVVHGRQEIASGDRIQLGTIHFKVLSERDVEHEYHVAVYEMMMRDGLTQLFNRRKFDEEAAREFARCSRYGRPLSLVLFDIDELKTVNDTHGHPAADGMIRNVAARARELCRTEQTLARLGGDEFAILCPEVEPGGVMIFAERLRTEIEALEHHGKDGTFRVSCSFGVASWTPAMTTFEDLFKAADDALYASKVAGRNLVRKA